MWVADTEQIQIQSNITFYPVTDAGDEHFVGAEFSARESFAFVFYHSMTVKHGVDKRIDHSTARQKCHAFWHRCWRRHSFDRCTDSIAMRMRGWK